MSDPPGFDPSLQPAVRVNAAAGQHPVVADPLLLAAAERAAEATRRRLPYLEARFGARGRAFTASDGGWLMALALHDPHRLASQVAWLAGLLASRGMPRLVLEHYLAALVGELEAAAPGGHEAWSRLAAVGEGLAASRRATLPDDLLAARAGALGDLREAAGAPRDALELLAAAVSDEAAGVAGALAGLLGWLADPERFPADWCEAVRRTAVGWLAAP